MTGHLIFVYIWGEGFFEPNSFFCLYGNQVIVKVFEGRPFKDFN